MSYVLMYLSLCNKKEENIFSYHNCISNIIGNVITRMIFISYFMKKFDTNFSKTVHT